MQRRLLEPFKKLRGAHLTATSEGAADSAYGAEVHKAMIPTIPQDIVTRVRADRWYTYHLATTIKIQGDEAFKAGDLDWARNHNDTLLYLQSRQQEALNNAGLRVNTTHDFVASKDNLNMRTEISHALAAVRLRLAGKPIVLERRVYRLMGQLVWLQSSECAGILYYRGIAMAKLDSPSVAIDCLHKALLYSPGDKAIHGCLCLVARIDIDPALRDHHHSALCAATDGDFIVEKSEVVEAEQACLGSVGSSDDD